MKRKSNYLKSAVPALALSLILLGSITQPSPEPESFPRQPAIGEEIQNPEDSDGTEIQPLSDLDDKEKMKENK